MRHVWIAAFCIGIFIFGISTRAAAQDQNSDTQLSPSTRLESFLKRGKISFDTRFRFEGFEREGAPFTGTAYAPTLRVALGYETAVVHGFSIFAQGEAVFVTGNADYNDPTLPSQFRPDRPAIFDPKSMELRQGYLHWVHGVPHRNLGLTIGRQEIILNDGRFVSISAWRQVHGSYDAARLDTELPFNLSLTYAFINRAYRVVGYNATDGKPPMHTHMLNLKWSKDGKFTAAFYSLLLNYRDPAQFAMSTQTYGVRLTGPYQFGQDWSLLYTAEYAKQKNYGNNPNRVDANYYLGEIGPAWRDVNFYVGYALLGGRSATDKLTTPLARPFNGWTDLFFNDPSVAGANGLDARYFTLKGPISFLDNTIGTVTYYDYHSDNLHIHYGAELDAAMAYKIKKISNGWEIGWRFGRYWSDRLFTNAIRTSIYTSFTL